MSQIVLETIDLHKAFGALIAVKNVSIQVKENRIHSVIGPNGAGKTTLFNLLSRAYPVTAGKIIFKGKDITHLPSYRTAHLGMGRSFQITNLFPNLTAIENVRLAVQSLGKHNFFLWRHYSRFKEDIEKAELALEEVGLFASRELIVSTLPHGDQRKLELAMILASDPDLLLLDEPTAGLAIELVPEFMNLVRRIQREKKKTVILVEHNMNVIMNVSDFITVMHLGEVLAEGTPEEISSNKLVQDAYLGRLYGNLKETAGRV